MPSIWEILTEELPLLVAKCILFFEISSKNNNRFRESSIEITDASFLDRSHTAKKVVLDRNASPEQVRGDKMRGLLEYSHSLPYRPEVILFLTTFEKLK